MLKCKNWHIFFRMLYYCNARLQPASGLIYLVLLLASTGTLMLMILSGYLNLVIEVELWTIMGL